jgi:hypothetical protein
MPYYIMPLYSLPKYSVPYATALCYILKGSLASSIGGLDEKLASFMYDDRLHGYTDNVSCNHGAIKLYLLGEQESPTPPKA